MNENDTTADDVDGDARKRGAVPWGHRTGPNRWIPIPRWLSIIAILFLCAMAVYQITTGSYLFAIGIGLLAVGLGFQEASSLQRTPQDEHDRTSWALFLIGQWTVIAGVCGLLAVLLLSSLGA